MPRLPNLIRAQQLTPPLIDELCDHADFLREKSRDKQLRRGFRWVGDGLYAFSLYTQPSTRTSLSHRTACARWGITVQHTDFAKEASSFAKGETLEDTIHTLCELEPSLIVMRHDEEGTLERAAKVAVQYSIPVINSGDGTNQHPTQALLDLYTIRRQLGKLSGLTVVCGGDCKRSRTVRSLAYLLAKYPGNKIVFVSTEALRPDPSLLDYLTRHKTKWELETCLSAALEVGDAFYWTRNQVEYGGDTAMTAYKITPNEMAKMKTSAILMHPLPRVDEITVECDTDQRSVYFKAIKNGLWIRMALIGHLLGFKVR